MILDERSEFADAVAVSTAGTSTYNVGDVMDLTQSDKDIGNGHDIYLDISVDTAFTSTGSATVQFQLVSSTGATPGTTGDQTVHWQSAAIPVATLVAGYRPAKGVSLPQGTYERYMGVQAVVGVSALTAGKINANLTLDKRGNQAYPDATN